MNEDEQGDQDDHPFAMITLIQKVPGCVEGDGAAAGAALLS
jgi:hypothetical protein